MKATLATLKTRLGQRLQRVCYSDAGGLARDEVSGQGRAVLVNQLGAAAAGHTSRCLEVEWVIPTNTLTQFVKIIAPDIKRFLACLRVRFWRCLSW